MCVCVCLKSVEFLFMRIFSVFVRQEANGRNANLSFVPVMPHADSRLSPLCCTEQHVAQETVMRMEPGPPSPPCRPVEPMFCRLMMTAQVMRLRTEPGPPSASVKLVLRRLCLMVNL